LELYSRKILSYNYSTERHIKERLHIR